MHLTNHFREYLQERLVCLTESYSSYKQQEEEEQNVDRKLYLNSCAIAISEVKDEIVRCIAQYELGLLENKKYKVLALNIFEFNNAALKIAAPDGLTMTLELPNDVCQGFSVSQKVERLFFRADNMCDIFVKPLEAEDHRAI